MSIKAGRNAAFTLTDIVGDVKDLSAYFNQLELSGPTDSADVTGFQDLDTEFVLGMNGNTLRGQGNNDFADGGPADVLGELCGGGVGGTIVSDFVFGPAGSATGAIKYSGTCFVTGYSPSHPIGGGAAFSADFQISGAVDVDTF